jgi:mono/diheme cytochrome c family protein
VNPVPAGPQAVEVGRLAYQQNCASCHGLTGLGDGPQASSLQPPPADLRVHTPLHPDRQIYAFIAQGFPGSAMPAFSGRLSETQMWSVVHYLRAMTTPATR